MAETIRIEGMKELRALLAQMPGRAKSVIAGAMFECGEEVRTDSIAEVPVDTGALKNSARVFMEAGGQTVAARGGMGTMRGAAARSIGPIAVTGSDQIAVTVAYGGPALGYAVPVHERTDLHHPHGKAHFLSDPFKRYPFGAKMGAKMRGRLERAIARGGV